MTSLQLLILYLACRDACIIGVFFRVPCQAFPCPVGYSCPFRRAPGYEGPNWAQNSALMLSPDVFFEALTKMPWVVKPDFFSCCHSSVQQMLQKVAADLGGRNFAARFGPAAERAVMSPSIFGSGSPSSYVINRIQEGTATCDMRLV